MPASVVTDAPPTRRSSAARFALWLIASILVLSATASIVPEEAGAETIATSIGHTCVADRGAAKCWGANWEGQLGDGTADDKRTPTQVNGLAFEVSAVSAGLTFSCAVVATSVKCWGHGELGVGDGTYDQRLTPVEVIPPSAGVTDLSGGDEHACAVVAGAAICWGDNREGQLGNGSQEENFDPRPAPTTPAQVVGLDSGVTGIAAGGGHTCAIVDQAAMCWGDNDFGQLGDGTTTRALSPIAVPGLESGVTAISAGRYHTCAVVNGAAKCWGADSFGQIGKGTTGNALSPVTVAGLATGATTISAGQYHTCAIATGEALCWGEGFNGRLGWGPSTGSRTPVQVADLDLDGDSLEISAGGEHSCAATALAIKCWGTNNYGQLGVETPTYMLRPISVIVFAEPAPDAEAASISSGNEMNCAVTVTNEVRCWGRNHRGQLGLVHFTNMNLPQTVDELRATEVAAGTTHACALTVLSTVECWGTSPSGALGRGLASNPNPPGTVTAVGVGAKAVAAGARHSCAITASDGVMCWGDNGRGQVGNGGSTGNVWLPAGVSGLSGGVRAISLGREHSCALLKTGAVKCWGRNDRGQLGDGTLADARTPRNVAGLGSGVQSVDAGGFHTCATTTAGAAKCWGYNRYGQLGNGTRADSSTPVSPVGLGRDTAVISTGLAHSCAVRTSGVALCWGFNRDGQLGVGDTASRSKATRLTGFSSGGATAISTGQDQTCVITTTGSVACSGANLFGQVGDGSFSNRTAPVAVPGFHGDEPGST